MKRKDECVKEYVERFCSLMHAVGQTNEHDLILQFIDGLAEEEWLAENFDEVLFANEDISLEELMQLAISKSQGKD